MYWDEDAEEDVEFELWFWIWSSVDRGEKIDIADVEEHGEDEDDEYGDNFMHSFFIFKIF
jgi:hypothetical protein